MKVVKSQGVSTHSSVVPGGNLPFYQRIKGDCHTLVLHPSTFFEAIKYRCRVCFYPGCDRVIRLKSRQEMPEPFLLDTFGELRVQISGKALEQTTWYSRP